MTRVIRVTGALPQEILITEDPRSCYELVKVINTGRLVVGQGDQNQGASAPQRALALPAQAALAVLTAPPPPLLTELSYDTIYGLAQGLTLEQMALRVGISRRCVCKNLEHLKERFQVNTREEILMRAMEMGIL
jgi:DNA-binding NarL/FixJ family response regulator